MDVKPTLTQGPIPKVLLMFSLPIIFGNMLQTLNGSINSIWVGSYLGEAALSATSNANLVMFVLLAAVFGVSMATTILVAQDVGAKNYEAARRVTGTSASFFLLLSLATSIFGFVFTPHLLVLMHTPPDAVPYALAYMRIIFIATPFMYGFFFVMAVLRGTGDSRTPFIFLVISVVLDIGLNPLLIFGWGPVPKLGIAGSAIASLIGQSLSLTGLIAYLYRSGNFLCIRRHELRLFRIDWHIVRILIVKGMPMGLQMMVVSSSLLVMLSFVNHYGSQVTAAFAAAMQLWSYIQMPALALGSSVSSMVAQNVGAGQWDRVGKIASAGVGFNFLISGALILIVYALNRDALSLFLPPGGEALDVAVHINAMIIWSFAFFGVTMVLFGAVRATGATLPPLILLFLSLWMFRIPCAYFLQQRWGANGIWWSFPLASLVSTTLAVGYYRYGGWRSARMDTHSAPAVGTA